MKKLNPEIAFLEEKLSEEKKKALLFLKEKVDQLATKPFLDKKKQEEIYKNYHTLPHILTWGDYFQVEVATSHSHLPEEEFLKVIETIYFDLLSSIFLFEGKEKSFLEEVEANYYMALEKEEKDWDEEDKFYIHLGILLNYYKEMQPSSKNLQEEDFTFYERFLRKAS